MDTESYIRYETIAGATKWKPYHGRTRGIFKVEEADWANLLRCPVMPTQAVDRIQAAGTMDGQGHYSDRTSAKWKISESGPGNPEGFRTVRVSREKPRLPVTGNIRFPLWCLDKFQTSG